jgi:[ribosomal protein S5]-alanine N-acetyltransferase
VIKVGYKSKGYFFESARLGFRSWTDQDLAPFSKMNADSEVMEYFPVTLSEKETKSKVESYGFEIETQGFGLWAVDVKLTGEFIGFIGFHEANFKSDFTPCLEIGWRLDKPFWNRGYATEGATRCLHFGSEIGLSEVYSFTAIVNKRSERVMQKIGMRKMGEFDHPKIENDHPLKRHVLYKTFLQTHCFIF